MGDQNPCILPVQNIVPHGVKLLDSADVLSRQNDPSVSLHDSTIVCLKLYQGWCQGVLLGLAFSAQLREQAPEMTQWYTVCLSSRVNLNFHFNGFALKFNINVSDDLCFAITVCVRVDLVNLVTIIILLIANTINSVTHERIDKWLTCIFGRECWSRKASWFYLFNCFLRANRTRHFGRVCW